MNEQEVTFKMHDGSFRRFVLKSQWTVVLSSWTELTQKNIGVMVSAGFAENYVAGLTARMIVTHALLVVLPESAQIRTARCVRAHVFWKDGTPVVVGLVPGVQTKLTIPQELKPDDTENLHASFLLNHIYADQPELTALIVLTGRATA